MGYRSSRFLMASIEDEMSTKIEKTDQEWREELTPEQYEVLRRKGTEPPFTGRYVHSKEDGVYRCAGCGAELFSSGTKFDSGTGWPSFYEPAQNANIELVRDTSHGMVRTEVVCGTCGGHLGHVFPDGPAPTGQRYCMNSCALELDPSAK
jgi:peptide-methionine (R)-S-oxide reductase